ncbi:restriction endonuclease subunit S [Tenacibaculum maritimum]|uniref:Type I restriction-modification enzyme S subunit, HsdS family n=1 Tax=Tenacibaculum maritimum NCIMB 2154 TaxID=1349785 RepID=A0A2H1EBN5_9FLAO|nr:restriction endonuclease subunit S [Tenacibaculum maritimum]SFZ84000.1 Type I restriction-modification enzyme S subunit, HsdS family [Tenacibaculum maritimum NCIMB 2154]
MEKAYETYKDSDVEWIGKIPENWKSVSLKWISNITKGRKPKVDYDESGENLLPYLSMEFLRDKTSNPTYASIDEKGLVFVDDGDILILWDGSKAGEIVKAKKGVLSSTMAKIDITDSDFESTYLNYLLQLGEKHIQENTIGMGIPHVSGDVLKGLKMLLPPKQEQTQIAAYLDYHTQLIDTLISKKETLIQKLQEQRQAIINEAVTKGLNKNVALKDSGIEWLGEIPEHWEVVKLKYVLNNLNNIRIPLSSSKRGVMKNKVYDYYGASGVIDKVEDYLFEGKNILIGEDGANLISRSKRLVFIADGKYWVNNHAHILHPKIGDIEFYTELLELIDFTPIIEGSAQPKLTQDALMNIQIPNPPVEEQIEIKNFINIKIKKANDLIYKIKNSIQKLKAYRQSLISEAVTGKIDVRDWQLPNS